MPVNYILANYKGSISTSNLEYLICSIISFCALNIVFLAKQRNLLNHRRIMNFIRTWIYFFIALMGIFLLITIAGLNLTNEYITDKTISIFIEVVSLSSGLCVFIISSFMIYIKNANEKIEKLIKSERKLHGMYLTYYQSQLDREEDTRKYRHDLSKHLVCLSELANNNNIEMINEYIKKMHEQILYIQKKSYYVGNEILDAVLNYYLPMLEGDIKIEITGNYNEKEKVSINNVDLCTIFSNLIQNSVEELTRKSSSKKFLAINLQYGKAFFSIEIRNSISSENQNIYENFFDTKKHDKKNHGFGLQNVKEAVEKNRGIFEIKRGANEVISKVVLKIN